MRIAHVVNNLVVNMLDMPELPSSDSENIFVEATQLAAIGSRYENETFIPAALNLDQAKAAKALAINAGARADLFAITSGYESAERETWSVQIAEADALVLDPNVTTPMLSAIAEQRGVTTLELALSVREKALAFKQIAGLTLGRQYAKLKQVEEATSIDEVNAASW